MILEELQKLVNEVTRPLLGRNLDAKVETWLNDELPPASATYRGLFDACRAGAAAGLICNREAGGIQFGRLIQPAEATYRLSGDVVEMEGIVGPHHAPPNGQIDFIM